MAESMLALETEAQNRRHDVAQIIASGASGVERFYAGSNIFVTGGSGFLGKLLIEKLFRCCNVNKVYLLLRSKKEQTAQQRVNKILEDPVFDSLHKHKPDFAENIIAVSGDIGEVKLGLSASDWNLIIEQANIIFHTAATVNFNERIKVVALTNVRGTREILRLAKCCKNLRSIVHVSTAYAHATRSRINQAVEEQFYDSPISPNVLIEMAETVEEHKLENMIQLVRENWPNTYSFSKALAEEVVRTEGEDLPISIVRPAVVISSYRDPVPGWVDPMNSLGPSGLIIGLLTGIIHVLRSRKDTVMSLVPADLVTNTTLVAGWENTKQQTNVGDIKIYNVTNNRNPLTWAEIDEAVNSFGRKMVSSQAIWYCFTLQTTNKFLYIILFWLLHYVPAFFVDTACRLRNRPPILINIYKRIYKLLSVLDFFINNDWKFQDNNTLGLHQSMSSVDRDIFNCDMATLDRKEMVNIWTYGIRKYIIKDVDFKRQGICCLVLTVTIILTQSFLTLLLQKKRVIK